MANIRNFKKNVENVCSDLVTDAMIAATYFADKVDAEKIDAIINEIAALQFDTIALASVSYDRTPKDFDNVKEYNKGRRTYFKTAFSKLEKEFLDRAMVIVKQLNEVVPEEVRVAVSGK